MAEIIGVTFKPGGKVYYFAPGDGEYTVGKGVIVETARGTEYATVSNGRTEVDDSALVQPLKPVIRVATKRDEETHKRNVERRPEALKTVKEKIEQYGLDMKLIDCEFAFDGSKAVFYYSPARRFQGTRQGSFLDFPYAHRASAGGHTRRNQTHRRTCALRQGMLLRELYARHKESFH